MFDSYNKRKKEELKKLKSFFEEVEKQSDKENEVAGRFGEGYPVFFGNVIQYNSFDIPYSAMRLIYNANKEKINTILSH